MRVVIQEPGIILPQELILFDLYRSSAYEVDQNVTDLGVIITTVTIKDVNQHRGWIFYCVQRYQLSTVRSDELTISQPAAGDMHIYIRICMNFHAFNHAYYKVHPCRSISMDTWISNFSRMYTIFLYIKLYMFFLNKSLPACQEITNWFKYMYILFKL